MITVLLEARILSDDGLLALKESLALELEQFGRVRFPDISPTSYSNIFRITMLVYAPENDQIQVKRTLEYHMRCYQDVRMLAFQPQEKKEPPGMRNYYMPQEDMPIEQTSYFHRR